MLRQRPSVAHQVANGTHRVGPGIGTDTDTYRVEGREGELVFAGYGLSS